MLSSKFLAVLAAAAVACSADGPGDETSSPSGSEAPNGEAGATANPRAGNVGTVADADRDAQAIANTVRDSGGPKTGDVRLSSSNSDGGSSVRSDAASSDYNPCPAKGTPCALMPVGDSITFGADATLGYNVSNGGYRTHLFDLAHRNGKALTFVGSLSNGPDAVDGVPFPKAHEGHPGWVIVQITDVIVSAIQTYKPRVITLMIGTNDINADFNPPDAPNRLAKLVDTILATDPQVLLVVAKIVPTQSASENTKVQAYNSAIGDLVATRAAAGKHVALVDMYAAFSVGNTSNYLSDNLHPNDAGYTVMAETWFGSIGPLLR
jgi:lysophospholipase L1-like esterase